MVKGKVLTEKKNQEWVIVLLFDWLWGRILAAILWPLHYLGKKLVYKKINSAIGISKVQLRHLFSRPELKSYLDFCASLLC